MQLPIVNPYDGGVVGEIPYDTPRALDEKLSRASEAQRCWRETSLEKRIRAVREACEYFKRNAEEVARDVTLQMGKPIQEARGEVKTLLARSERMLEIAPTALATDVLPSKPGFQLRIQ